MVPAESLFDSLTLSEKVLAQTKLMTIDEFIRVLVSQSKAPVVTGVEVLGHSAESGNDKQKNAVTTATLKLANLGVFRNDKLVGWLDDNDSKGYNYITGNVKNTVNSLPLSTGQIVEIKIVKSKVKLATSLENQQPVINVSLTIEGTIAGITADMDLSKEENIRLIEVEEGKEIEKLLTETVATAETVYVTDFLGFGDFIHRSDPKIWALLKDDWDNTFTHLPVNIAVQVKITGIGTKGKPILKDIKE
jgi:spore germination protein KC